MPTPFKEKQPKLNQIFKLIKKIKKTRFIKPFVTGLNLSLLCLIIITIFFTGGLKSFNSFAENMNFGGRAVIIGENAVENIKIDFKPSWSLISKIEEAKLFLSKSGEIEFTSVGGQLVRKQIALAILDTKTGDLFIRKYWLDQKEVEEASRLRKFYLENEESLPFFTPADTEEEPFEIKVKWWNDHNSDLEVVDPISQNQRFVIVANKFLISNDYLAYPEDKTGNEYSSIIYTPYSSHLHSEELINEGLKYLNIKVAEAFNELKNKKIKSRPYPSKLVTDTISQEFVKNLFIAEQTDPKLILGSKDGGLYLAQRVLVRLGANKDKTFRYTYSKTGALGLGQIMPGTYDSVVSAYPQAKLIIDTDIGRVDIINSIQGTILTLDDHFAVVVSRAGQSDKWLAILNSKSANEIEEIRAAIYNGGPGKYEVETGTISDGVTETADFVRKIKLIRSLKLFS